MAITLYKNEYKHNQYTLQSVSNALDILDLLTQYPDLSIAEVSKCLNLGKTTVFRLLTTLEQHHYLAKDANSRYRLSFKLAGIGDAVTRRNEVIHIVHPYLERISNKFNETSHLLVWQSSSNVVVIDRVIGQSPISYKTIVGFTTPAHVAASGRALLAFSTPQFIDDYIKTVDFSLCDNNVKNKEELYELLDEIRANGVAKSEGNAVPGLNCYAVPIFNRDDKAIASISVSGAQASLERIENDIIDELKASVHHIQNDIINGMF